MLQKEGLGKPDAIANAVSDYRHDSDKVTQFAEERLTADAQGEVRTSAVYNEYRRWCEANGCYPENARNFNLEPYTLFGYRVFVSNCLPDPEPGNITVFFGDFNWFWIAERGKRIIKRLEERFAESGQVAFITSERVDGVLVLPDAVKSLKIAE